MEDEIAGEALFGKCPMRSTSTAINDSDMPKNKPQSPSLAQIMQHAGIAYNARDWTKAEKLCRSLLNAKPDYFDALNLLGIIAAQTRRTQEAAELLARAIDAKPDSAHTHNNYGNVLRELGQFEGAIASYNRAIAIKPNYAEAHSNKGVALQELRQLEAAVASYEKAIAIKPDFAQAHINRGVTLRDLKQLDAAVASHEKAISINPYFAEAHYNLGIALQDLKRLDMAVASYDKAIALDTGHAEAYSNRGNALQELRRFDDALDSYARALKIRPDHEYLYGSWLHAKMTVCDWNNHDANVAVLVTGIGQAKRIAAPFLVLALTDSMPIQRQAAETWADDKYPASPLPPHARTQNRKGKIHLGYYSADFRSHATSHLMAELFEQHDKAQFELTAFSFGPDIKDETQIRLSAAFDRFIDVRMKSDREIAELSRNMQIDIAVDLKGFTLDERTGIFSHRAAPAQVNYLGYPGTMGAKYIDYIVADPTLIPTESRKHYSEKVVYLPDSYQVNDRRRAISEKVFSRSALGLPTAGFVFCCFNNNYKITPHTFDGWMRILKQVDGSVLWLLEDNPTSVRNLRREAAARGVDAERLIFAKRMPLEEHLARHRTADLFLDTLPYNAHTTASDALWAGLPLLTCMGTSFASRVAASLLNAIRLPELIARSQEEYEALAIELATDSRKLADIREKLAINRLTTPLFNTPVFAKKIEAAYVQIHERCQADLPPQDIHIG